MTFRLRVTILTAAAVAVAVVAATLLMYVVLQTQLLTQFDRTLQDAAQVSRGEVPGVRGVPGFRPGSLSGRSDVAAQVINATTGTVVRYETDPVTELVTPQAVAVASGRHDAYFFETTLEGYHIRGYVAPLSRGTAIQVWRPLSEIDTVLSETRTRLVLVAIGGVLLAAALGTVIAGAALRPIRRLTNIVEEVARTRDLSRRVAAETTDELGRLAASFNLMLAELEVALRSQRQLVADASHELRTPLTSLRTNLELLERGQPTDPAEREQVLHELVGQIERLSTLVADLIDLARDSEAPLVVEDVRLDEVVSTAIDDMRIRYPSVRFQVDGAPSVVRGVRSRIARAVTNLLDNAGKWSTPGGLVEVTVGSGEMTVRDHGPGVSPEDESRLFDRFWRAASARALPGSGLGLAIVKDVAESHGGRVRYERPEGGGARFRLSLGSS